MAYTTIDKPTDYFNTVLYTGNGSTNAITGVGFQPDWVWLKDRDVAEHHNLYDVVRGTTKVVRTSMTNAEGTDVNGLTSFDSDGFTLGSGTNQNLSGSAFVSWNWLAGGTASSNTDGSITSSVSANTTAGFSIVSYTGTGSNATVGHGLGAEAKCIIFKDRDTASDWRMYHVGVGNTGALTLNNTNATQTNSVFFQDTTPTSTVFSLGTGTDVNNNTKKFIAYCFAEKKGFSKFGSYTGNGSTDGTFVYTGFKPAFFILKASDAVKSWYMYDSKRPGFNVNDDALLANTTDSEFSSNIDFLSNGVKIRTSGTGENQSGTNYIFICFSENPFVTSTGIPTTAR